MLDRMVDWLARRTALELALILAAVAELLFLAHLGDPNKMVFDETHYVRAARIIYGLESPANEEHPVLAKWLIGLSMDWFGDTPWGWRVLGTVAGTATALSIFWIAMLLFQDRRTAVTAGVIALLDQLLFIQARIAMLDTYMAAFLMAGLAFALWAWRGPGDARWRLAAAGLSLGLAVACKWAAAPYVALACIAAAIARWRDPARFAGTSLLTPALWIGIPALVAYFVSFAPAFWYQHGPLSIARLLPYQLEMYVQQTKPLSPHTYMSDWWQWPLISRPIWYFYEQVDGVQRGILLVGNPAIMWGGLIAVAACLWWGVKDRSPALLWAGGIWVFAFALWVVIPKKIGFYYYYYLPALFLSLALAGAFQKSRTGKEPAIFLTVALAAFLYFYPIIAALPLVNDQAFLTWMWFDSWR